MEATVGLSEIMEPELPAREKMDGDNLQSLMTSLRELGQIDAIKVVRRGEKYEIADGHRRYIAAQRLGWKTIRGRIYPADCLELEAIKVASMLEREDWNPAEEAVYYAQLMEKYSLDGNKLCALVRRSADHVGKRLVLYHGDPVVFEAMRSGLIGFGVASELARCTDEMMRRSYLHSAILGGAGQRIVKGWVEEWKARQMPGAAAVEPAAAAAAAAPGGDAALLAPGAPRACVFCGGYMDQYNLIEVTVHKYEWDRVLKSVRNAQQRFAEGEKPNGTA